MFNNYVKCSKKLVLSPFFESELAVIPSTSDKIYLLFNLVFLLSTINDFRYFVRVFVKVKFN